MSPLDSGHDQRRSNPGDPLSADPRAGDGNLDHSGKSSRVREWISGSAGDGLLTGWEAGPLRGLADSEAPASPAVDADDQGLDGAAQAGALRARVIRAVGPGVEVSVAVTRAVVREGGGERTLTAYRVGLGGTPTFPAWVRVTLPPGEEAGLSPAWCAAAARETAAWSLPAAAEPAALPLASGLPLVLDAFAAADLLRAAAAGWLAPGRAGSRVAAPTVAIDDLGPQIGSGAAGHDPDARDAEGTPMRPFAVVRDGRLVGLPRTADAGAPTGSVVRGSWRTPARAGWRSLVLDAGPPQPWPDDAVVLTRVIPLHGDVLVAGHVRRAGRAVVRLGPAPAPPPGWWLARVAAALDHPVADASGLPVAVPALLVTL